MSKVMFRFFLAAGVERLNGRNVPEMSLNLRGTRRTFAAVDGGRPRGLAESKLAEPTHEFRAS
jgi:hypothetical protein